MTEGVKGCHQPAVRGGQCLERSSIGRPGLLSSTEDDGDCSGKHRTNGAALQGRVDRQRLIGVDVDNLAQRAAVASGQQLEEVAKVARA
jgi:hypothetical protein